MGDYSRRGAIPQNREYPVADVPPGEQIAQMPEATQRFYRKWASLVTGLADPATYTDYVILNK
jgi:hypothetical protein